MTVHRSIRIWMTGPLLAGVLGGVLGGGLAAARAADALPVIELAFVPANQGQSEAATAGRVSELQIFADGRVVVPAADRVVSAQLSSKQLDNLQRELLLDCRLGQVSTAQIRSDIQAASLRHKVSSVIPGADDTVIRLRTPNTSVDLSCPAVGLLATRFPDVESLAGLLAAQERLQNIRALVLLGDGRQATQLTQQANESLQLQIPGAKPLSPRDLLMVHTLPDGTRLVQFSRRTPSSVAAESQLVIVSLMETPGQQPRITVMSGDSVIR